MQETMTSYSRKRKRKRMVKNVLTWCFRYYIVLGCTVSSMALPTTYSVDGVNVGYEINRKWRSREENKITALAIGKRKRKRPVINRGHHHEVGGSRDVIAVRGEIQEKGLTLGSMTCKILHSGHRNMCMGDGMMNGARKQKSVKKHDKKSVKERRSLKPFPTTGGRTTLDFKQGLRALKHLSIEDLESEMHRAFAWNSTGRQVEEREYDYDNVNYRKDNHAQEGVKCKHESEKVQPDSWIDLANRSRSWNLQSMKQQQMKKSCSMSESEGFVLRPRSRPPKTSEPPPTTHQPNMREVMGREGQWYGKERPEEHRSGSSAAEPEGDGIVINTKNGDKVVQRTKHSAVAEFSLPYVEDGSLADAETTFTQSEDMLEHLCVDNACCAIDVGLDITFSELGVTSLTVLDNLAKMGILKPTTIQVQALRELMGGSDLDAIIHSYTGSGKTLAFLLPILQTVNISSNAVQALVIVPGRELGSQIFGVCDAVARGSGARVQMVIGGASIKRQMDRMKKNKPHILIGTPGRLCELLQHKRFRSQLRNIKFLVLDEVDSLMSDPYNHDVEKIVDSLSGSMQRKTVFSSATGCTSVVLEAASRLMKSNRVICSAAHASSTASSTTSDLAINKSRVGTTASLPLNIRHCFLCVPKVKKLEILRKFLHTKPYPEYVMVFVNDPYQGKWLTEALERKGIIAAPLFGDASKIDRAQIMNHLRSGSIGMVVTTEMSARGIDITNLSHVVNYDLPTDAEHYVHRAGRCGRAGRPGIVVNLVLPNEAFVISKFEKSLNVPITEAEIRENKLWTLRTEFWESLQKSSDS